MILALLTEVIAVHMWLTIIYLYYFSFKGLFALRRRLSRFLVCLQVGFYKFFEQFIGSNRSGSRSRSRSGNQSGNHSGNQIGARDRVMRQSGRGTTWMGISNGARVFGKLIFYWVNRRGVLTRGITRARSSGSYLGRWLGFGDKVFFQTSWLTRWV